MLNTMRDKNEGMYREEAEEETYDHVFCPEGRRR